MCWNAYYDADAIRTYCAAHPEVKYLLGFNEPNFTNQANMTPEEAAAKWPDVRALADELGLQIVAPALNYSPNPPYQSPTRWMDEFVAIVGEDAFDFTAIHSYGGFGVLRDLATEFHNRYKKPVWVTEFCLWPDEGNPNAYVAPESQIASMIQSVEWLEKTDWIYRYAWFKAVGDSDAAKGPNYGLLIPGKAEDPRSLSQQGVVYVNMPDFDPDVYHPVSTTVGAGEFIAQDGILLGANNDPGANGAALEITRFNAGASVDYQFDIPESGDYTLLMRYSGVGEPVRFDPTIGVYTPAGEGDEATAVELSAPQTLTLPGNDDTYMTAFFQMNLPAGHTTLRLVDTTPGRPSGIHISAIELRPGLHDESGVGMTAADADRIDVYSLQGFRVREAADAADPLAGLPAGIYIARGKKIIKK